MLCISDVLKCIFPILLIIFQWGKTLNIFLFPFALRLFLITFINGILALSQSETETGKEQKMCTATHTSPKNALELHPVN